MSEKVTIKVERQTHHLPAIALRGLVVFPNNLVHFEVGRDKSIAAIEWAMSNNSNVFLVAQKKMDTDEPTRDDLFTYGVVAEIKQVLRVSDELVRVLVEGKYRARMTDLDDGGKFLLAAVQPAPVRGPKEEDALQTDAMVRSLKSVFDDYLALNQRLAKDVVFAIVSSDDPVFLSEYIPANLLFRYEDKQAVMDENTLTGRLEKLIELLRRECQVMEIEKEISDKVNESMDKNQQRAGRRGRHPRGSGGLPPPHPGAAPGRRERDQAPERSGPPGQDAGQQPGGHRHPHLSGYLPGPALEHLYRG